MSTHFDYLFYINYYKDLGNKDYIQACNHFINHGIKEQRLFNPILIYFNYENYIYKKSYFALRAR